LELVFQTTKDHKVVKALQDQQGQLALQDLLDPLAQQVQHLQFQDLQVQLEQAEPQDQSGQQVPQALLVQLA
jgi:hypothetical protein